MKVIGTSENHVILEATKSEVAELCGYYSKYNEIIRELKHGTIINVHGMYSQLYSLAQQEAKRKRAMSELSDMLEALKCVPAFEIQASSEGEPFAEQNNTGHKAITKGTHEHDHKA